MTEPDGVPSPAGFTAPPSTRPAWNWVPEGHGIHPRWEAVPAWVRLWYQVPFVDRYAYVWMWHHGGWWVRPFPPEPGPDGGVREPLPQPTTVRP